MTETDRHNDRPGEPAERIDRRAFLGGGLRIGGAITAVSLGAGALAASTSTAKPTRTRPPGAYRRTSQPNILVIVVDQLRTPRWYGPGGRTAALPPNIARLARSGVSFARPYTA